MPNLTDGEMRDEYAVFGTVASRGRPNGRRSTITFRRQYSCELDSIHLSDRSRLRRFARSDLRAHRHGFDAATVPDARYPAMTVRRFWEAVISATGDELIGLTCGQEMQAPTLHGLGLAIMTSHSLAQVLELTASYGKVISTTMDMSLAHNASSSSLSLRTLHGNEAKQAALLCVIAFIQRQANSLSQRSGDAG